MNRKLLIYFFVFIFFISFSYAENISTCNNCTLYNATIMSEDNTYQSSSIFGIIGVILFLLVCAWLLESEHFLLRFFLVSMAFVTLPVLGSHIINITHGTELASVGISIFKICNWTFRLYLIYVFLYFTYKVFDFFGLIAKLSGGRMGSK